MLCTRPSIVCKSNQDVVLSLMHIFVYINDFVTGYQSNEFIDFLFGDCFEKYPWLRLGVESVHLETLSGRLKL
ncbi:hypothetical protein ACU18_15360 [Arthrobacter sp. ZBG10]|nr:hypothetical protein ACU18_15360 [Arthrobacter sp. ZBG10]